MNTTSNLYGRLLEGFPVTLLRSYFKVVGTKDKVISLILAKFTFKEIDDFTCASFGFLHQHIYIREVSAKLPSGITKLMSGKLLAHSSASRKSIWHYLHKGRIQYYDTVTGNRENLEFLIPVKIENRGENYYHVVQYFGKRHKNIF